MPDAKIITYGKEVGAGTTVIPDSHAAAVDIESTDAKDYVQIVTTGSSSDGSTTTERIVLGEGGGAAGQGIPVIIGPSTIYSTGAAVGANEMTIANGSGQEIEFDIGGTNVIKSQAATNFQIGTHAAHTLELMTANTARLQVGATGTVTIGSTEGDISIGGGTGGKITFARAGGVAINCSHSSGELYFQMEGSNKIKFDTDGHVGIGQTGTIDAPLHVIGEGGDTGMSWPTGDNSPTMIIENSSGASKDRCLLALNADGASGSSVDLYQGDNRRMNLGGTASGAYVYGDGVPLNLSASGTNAIKLNSRTEVHGDLGTQGAGTIVSISTATVTGSGTAFLTKFAPGSAVKFTNDADATEIRTVLSVSANDTMILTETPGATGSGRTTKTYFHDPDLFEIKSGDGLSRLKYDSLGQLTVCNTAQNNVIVSDGDITQMTGANNTILGGDQKAAISVSNRTTIGHRAGKGMTGASLTAVGQSSGEAELGSSGAEVTLVGYFSGNAGPGNSTVAVGTRALSANSSGGSGNVGVGGSAGIAITTGDNNTCIGNASNAAAALSNQIAIGAGAVCSAVSTAVIGDASNPATLDFSGSDNSWSTTSDERIKENIQDSNLGLEFINALRSITHTSKNPVDWPDEIRPPVFSERTKIEIDDDGNEVAITVPADERPPENTDLKNGLLAQEVKAVMDAQGVEFSGWTEQANGLQRIQYERLVLPLIKAVQELTARIEELENGE